MERSPYPLSINPNAKYLSNSISNVLYCIHKFDPITLAWPTCQKKRNVWSGIKRQPPSEVPLSGTASCVIPKRRCSITRGTARAEKKNTFYQILQASQDQSDYEECCRYTRKKKDAQFESNFKDDSIYDDIYDIVRTHVKYKKDPSATDSSKYLENSKTNSKPKSSITDYPVIEIYKLRERTNKPLNSTNPLDSTNYGKSRSKRSKHQGSKNGRENAIKETQRSSSKLRSKSPFKNKSEGRKGIPQTSIEQEKSKESSEFKSNFPTTQHPVTDKEGIPMTSMDPGEEEEIPIEDANDQRSSKRTSSVQRNSKDVNGRRSSKRRSPRLRSFAAENPFEILIVRARNAKGKASQPFVGNRHVKEVYKIKEITSKNKIDEENTIKEMDRTNSYIRGRSNWTSYQQGPTSRIVEEESVEIAPKMISKSPIAKDHIKEIYKVQEEPQYLKKGSFKEEEDITATKSIPNSTIDKDSSKKMHKAQKRSSKINEQQENLFAKSNHKFSKAKHHKNEIVRIRRAKEEPADLTPKLNLKSPIAKPPYPTKEIYKVHERSQNQKINQRNLKGEPTKSKPNSAIGQNPTSKTHKVRKKSNKLSEQQVNSNAKLNHKSLKAKHPRNNIHDYHAESEKPNEEENKTFEEKENITKSNTKVPIFQTLLKTISKVQNRSKSKKQANSVEEKGYGFPKRDNESFIYQYQKRSRNMNEQNGIDEGDLLLAAPSFANSYYDSTDQEKNYNNEPEKKTLSTPKIQNKTFKQQENYEGELNNTSAVLRSEYFNIVNRPVKEDNINPITINKESEGYLQNQLLINKANFEKVSSLVPSDKSKLNNLFSSASQNKLRKRSFSRSQDLGKSSSSTHAFLSKLQLKLFKPGKGTPVNSLIKNGSVNAPSKTGSSHVLRNKLKQKLFRQTSKVGMPISSQGRVENVETGPIEVFRRNLNLQLLRLTKGVGTISSQTRLVNVNAPSKTGSTHVFRSNLKLTKEGSTPISSQTRVGNINAPSKTGSLQVFRKKEKLFRPRRKLGTPTNSMAKAENGFGPSETDSITSAFFHENPTLVEDVIPFRTGSVFSEVRKSIDRRNLNDRSSFARRAGLALNMTTEKYNEKLKKVKQYLNREDSVDSNNTDTSSIDFEGIRDGDLLLYPYAEIYQKKVNTSEQKKASVTKRIKKSLRPTSKPSEDGIESEKEAERKTACIICRTIKRNPVEKEAPFLDEMRKEKRRRELLAYRANIGSQGEHSRRSLSFEPPDQPDKNRAFSLHDLNKKELYSLESKSIIFTR